MYNYYRWYPRGKVIFMAPTRPLVAQQIEACYKIMGIAKEDTAELTGKQKKDRRTIVWQEKRVFFATPQIVAGDLCDDDFPISDIRLIIIDEAHKAKGKYAYNEVVKMMMTKNKLFRLLALSATPGRKLEDVGEIVQNLLISHIEVRTEDSMDVAPYTFKKNIETVIVKMDTSFREFRDELIDIIDPYVRNLLTLDVITGSTQSLSRGWLVLQQKRYVESSTHRPHPNHSAVMTDFACCVTLYHALELLERHGLRIFLNFFDDNDDKKFYLRRDHNLRRFIQQIRDKIGTDPFSIDDNAMPNGIVQDMPDNLDFGHPKYEILRKQLLKHFMVSDKIPEFLK